MNITLDFFIQDQLIKGPVSPKRPKLIYTIEIEIDIIK